jgi:hypothetical protein
MGLADKDLKDKPYKEKGYDFRDYIPRGAYKKKYADGGSIGIEVLFEEKKPRKAILILVVEQQLKILQMLYKG